MRRVVPVLIALLLFLGGCGKSQVTIDWADFVKVNGVLYLRTTFTIEESNVGPQISTVEFKVADNGHESERKVKNGDAAFFPAGTPIYSINGYKSSFRIAVRYSDNVYVYQAFINSNAKLGSDFADIANKVDYIGVNEDTNDKEIAAIRDEQKVNSMVNMFLNAPVSQSKTDLTGKRYFISFHLKDGTYYKGPYWPETGEFSNGIMLPETFRDLVEDSLKL